MLPEDQSRLAPEAIASVWLESVRAEVDLTARTGVHGDRRPVVIVVVPAPFSEPVFPHTSVPEIDRVPVRYVHRAALEGGRSRRRDDHP